MALEFVGNRVCGTHETSTMIQLKNMSILYRVRSDVHIPDNRTGQAQIFAPTLAVPAVEQGLQRNLGLRVETIVTEKTMLG